jgi:hypothetical protein
MEKTVNKSEQFYTYKGYHLVRKNKEIYYGNMAGDFVAKIDVQSTKIVDDLELADKLKVSLLPTDTEKPLDLTMMKTTTRDNLFEALDVAYTWLNKANSEDVRIDLKSSISSH